MLGGTLQHFAFVSAAHLVGPFPLIRSSNKERAWLGWHQASSSLTSRWPVMAAFIPEPWTRKSRGFANGRSQGAAVVKRWNGAARTATPWDSLRKVNR